MDDTELTFALWKEMFHQDCVREGKLLLYSSLTEEGLRILWEAGIVPSVREVIDAGDKAA